MRELISQPAKNRASTRQKSKRKITPRVFKKQLTPEEEKRILHERRDQEIRAIEARLDEILYNNRKNAFQRAFSLGSAGYEKVENQVSSKQADESAEYNKLVDRHYELMKQMFGEMVDDVKHIFSISNEEWETESDEEDDERNHKEVKQRKNGSLLENLWKLIAKPFVHQKTD